MRIRPLVASVCLSFSGLGLALADTQYTYVGVNYNDAHAPYTTAMSLSGSMVLPATLPASQTDIVIGPGTSYPISSWSFSDGVNTYTQANAQILAGISIGDPRASRFLPMAAAISLPGTWRWFHLLRPMSQASRWTLSISPQARGTSLVTIRTPHASC